MNYLLLKMAPITALLCLAFYAPLHSFEEDSSLYFDEAPAFSIDPANIVTMSKSLHLNVDLLYWTSNQEGVEKYLSTTVTSPVDESSVRKFKSMDFDWRPGFRIGLGYLMSCGWDASSQWTHYQGHAHGHASRPIEGDPDLHTSGHWNLNYNVLDTVLKTPWYCINSCFTINYIAGLRAASIHQKMKALAEYELPVESGSTAANTLLNARFHGIGPLLGVTGDWAVRNGFSLYGDAKAALLFSYFKVNQSVHFLDTVADNELSSDHSKSHVCQVALDLGAGIRWNRPLCLCGHETDLQLKLGWEHTQWFNFNQFGDSLSSKVSTSATDLMTDGLTFSVAFSY